LSLDWHCAGALVETATEACGRELPELIDVQREFERTQYNLSEIELETWEVVRIQSLLLVLVLCRPHYPVNTRVWQHHQRYRAGEADPSMDAAALEAQLEQKHKG